MILTGHRIDVAPSGGKAVASTGEALSARADRYGADCPRRLSVFVVAVRVHIHFRDLVPAMGKFLAGKCLSFAAGLNNKRQELPVGRCALRTSDRQGEGV